jgi:DNA-binding SARP family transcriptional activator/TolB-like protein
MIELQTLGALELTSADNEAVGSVLAQPRRAALFCYLALALPRGFHRRDTLFALFWPEDDAEQARHALRQSLYFLRRALGAQTILSRGDEELALAPEQVRCDVWEFDAAIEQGRPADALAFYRGDLLAGFHISAAPDFERWLDQERSRLRQQAGEAAWALAAARERAGDATGAAEAARQAATFSSTDETALRRLVLLLERVGDRAAAVRAYEAFAWKLAGEYELEPSAETQAMVARIRAEPGVRQAVAPGGDSGPSLPRAENGQPKAGLHVAESSTVVSAADVAGQPEFRLRDSVPAPIPLPLATASSRRKAISLASALVVSLLLGGAVFYLRIQARERVLGATAAHNTAAAPGVAVLPFAVQDDALANWREGLVDLLSLDLSGVAGLRAVDTRTLLARWRERVAGGNIPDLSSSLGVAERAGASYAVVGSVIANGSDLLISAGVHEVPGRRNLGVARSQGPADSIFNLVDRLTLEILRLILRGDASRLPRIDLARVSTGSLPALKSYLEGEVLFRRSQFQGAAQAYGRAVQADSSFALAWYRLGLTRQWSWTDLSGTNPDPLSTEVRRFVDRLPSHEAALFRATQLSEQDVRAARELLEREVRLHPDDAETWHELGEFYHHFGKHALAPSDAADRAFARAIELDSTFTLPYMHRIDHAISTRDTAAAARQLRAFSRLAPQSHFAVLYGLVTGLAFGGPAARDTIDAALDTLRSEDLFWIGMALQGERCCWELAEQVLRMVRERGQFRPEATSALFWVSLAQGQAREALGWTDDPLMLQERKGLMLLVLDELGGLIPTARLDSELTLGSADSADAFQAFYAGAYAADRARWQVLQDLLERLRSRKEFLLAAGDSAEAGFTEAVRQGLEGYAWWRRGQRDTALSMLERAQVRAVGNWRREFVNTRFRWWLGRLLLEMGRPREALAYFESLWGTSLPASYQRGRIYEQLGETKRASEAYALFLAPRQHADSVFRPMIQDARAALQRLASKARE